MKKLLLSLAAVTFGISAFAGEVVFDFTASDAATTYGLPPYSYNENTQQGQADYISVPKTITSGDVTITLEGNETTETSGAWRLWSDGIRQYKSQNAKFTVSTNNGQNVTGVTWTVANNNVSFALESDPSVNLTSWTGSAASVSFVSTSSGNQGVKTITVTYGDTSLDVPTIPSPSKDVIDVAEALDLIDKGYTGEASVKGYIISISEVSVDYGNATYVIADSKTATSGLTVYRGYYLGGQKFTSNDQLAVGAEVIVKGNLMNYNNITPEIGTGNQIISYNGETYDAPEGPAAPTGTITVAQALKLLEDGWNGEDLITVKGIISSINEINTDYGNATYFIKDNLNDEASLEIYRGYGLNGDKFTAEDQLAVGATVTVTGKLVNYNGTYEFTTGSKIVDYTAPSGAVQGIEINNNAPVEYFNLQGVKVNNPSNGLYIIRQGDKTVKAVIR